jgi:hypothetical protein
MSLIVINSSNTKVHGHGIRKTGADIALTFPQTLKDQSTASIGARNIEPHTKMFAFEAQ